MTKKKSFKISFFIILVVYIIILIISIIIFKPLFLSKIKAQKDDDIIKKFIIDYQEQIFYICDDLVKQEQERIVLKEQEKNYYEEDILKGAIPEVLEGMIPIYYEDDEWKKADLHTKWYSYEELNWANVAVFIPEKSDYYKNANAGTIVKEEDILGYFVWVPRFEYKLFNVNFEKVPEQMIEVNFVSKEVSKKDIVENGRYFTHPAFTAKYKNKSYELNGFWIAKFEPSLNNRVEIKPNKHTLVNINTGKMLEYADSVSSDYHLAYQSRIITNMEWGAIAYLTQSQYGKENNKNYQGVSKKIFLNSAMGNAETWDNVTTGCSSGITVGMGTTNCPYKYNVKYYGTGASSTGTIYGIYDLAGGSWECVMGIVSDYPVKENIGGYIGKLPNDSRYYTLYKNGSMYDYSRGLIGDATRETLSSTIENKSWNGNLAYFATSGSPWIKRGGTFRGGIFSGIFDYGVTDALPRGDKTFRIILSKY